MQEVYMGIIPDGQMENTHKIQYKLKVGMDVLGNSFALSVLFTIGCIPVITAGASLAALYSMSQKYINSVDGPMIKGFWEDFKKNFKQATLAEIVTLIAFTVEWGFIYMMMNYDGILGLVYLVASIFFGFAICLTLPFLFPLMAHYDNTFINTIKNSFLLAISNLGSWLKVFLAWFAPIIFTVCTTIIFLSIWWMWLILIPGLIAYGTSLTMNKVFERVVNANEKREEKERAKEEAELNGKNIEPTSVKQIHKNRGVNISQKARMVEKFNNPEADTEASSQEEDA